MFFKYPYTDLYSLNLDWLIRSMKELQETIEQDRGERVLSFNTRTGTVTLMAADVNALGINSVAVVPSISGMSADAISAAYESGVRILLEGSAGNYTKAGFMVSAEEGIDICMLSVDMAPIQNQIDAIQDKVNPETAAAGDVFQIDAQGNSVWAPPTGGGTADLSSVAPVYTDTHPAIDSIGFYFYYNNRLRVSTRVIAANEAITDNNSQLITRGGLNDIGQNLENEITEIDNKLNPEAATAGNVLTINSSGESTWLPGPDTTELTRKVNALDTKINPSNGVAGNVLSINSSGESVWAPPATSQEIAAAVSDWLEDNVPTGTTVVVDRSLSIADAAADSKTVGDTIKGRLLTDDIKNAILLCFQNVAWLNDNSQTLYNNLYTALFNNTYPQITATFNAGTRTIYTDTNINNLKQYTTVTYYASAESQGVNVPQSDYTINGALIVGNNTLSITYENLTTDLFIPNVVDYYDNPNWSLANGDFNIISGSIDFFPEETQIRYTIRTPWDTRRAIYTTKGQTPYRLYGSSELSSYYPIPIPPTANKVTISVTPATQYIFTQVIHDNNGELTRLTQIAWTAGTTVATFTASTNNVLFFNLKYDAAGTDYPENPSNIIVTFEEV